jgi:hypothetical protein
MLSPQMPQYLDQNGVARVAKWVKTVGVAGKLKGLWPRGKGFTGFYAHWG